MAGILEWDTPDQAAIRSVSEEGKKSAVNVEGLQGKVSKQRKQIEALRKKVNEASGATADAKRLCAKMTKKLRERDEETNEMQPAVHEHELSHRHDQRPSVCMYSLLHGCISNHFDHFFNCTQFVILVHDCIA